MGASEMTEDRKADYSQIAEVYDEARPSDSPHLMWWFERVAEAGELGPGKRLIDLGCGTGRWTIPLVERTGCEAVGIDSSRGMLQKARVKDTAGRIEWLLGDVEHPQVGPESFDCAFMSLMMHHLEDHLGTFERVRHLLRPGGIFLIRQGTLEQIMDDVFHRFFPEALAIDRKRTPFRAEIEHWLAEAGFQDVRVEKVTQTSYPDVERLKKEVRMRVCSVLRLIDDEAFQRGLPRFDAYVSANPDDPWVQQDLFTLFSARKPRR
jgi:ubiquinone/menaquinone biosynthesis C-methylase UbiE